ncbi:MAG: hypothetical protein AB1487_11995 [Thermodesulfobacteriota bacterium]
MYKWQQVKALRAKGGIDQRDNEAVKTIEEHGEEVREECRATRV